MTPASDERPTVRAVVPRPKLKDDDPVVYDYVISVDSRVVTIRPKGQRSAPPASIGIRQLYERLVAAGVGFSTESTRRGRRRR